MAYLPILPAYWYAFFWHLVFHWSVLKVVRLHKLQGVLAFSEHGLMIRWWSLGSVWWEKLSRNFVPVQCTKVIFVPPWEGFSPNSSRLSIMASATEFARQADLQVISSLWWYADKIWIPKFNLSDSVLMEFNVMLEFGMMFYYCIFIEQFSQWYIGKCTNSSCKFLENVESLFLRWCSYTSFC